MRWSVPSRGIGTTATSIESIAVSPTVVTATQLEARAVRRACPGARVVHGGIGLTRTGADGLGDVVVSCGLAGGLRSDLRTGSVLVPHAVGRPNGEMIECDGALVAALESAARQLGYTPEPAPLLTCTSLVTGDARRAWSARGYVGVDMETALIRAPRVAAVRVVLDTPERELSATWQQPATVLLHPSTWGQLPWLWREAPRCARRAAMVLAAALCGQ